MTTTFPPNFRSGSSGLEMPSWKLRLRGERMLMNGGDAMDRGILTSRMGGGGSDLMGSMGLLGAGSVNFEPMTSAMLSARPMGGAPNLDPVHKDMFKDVTQTLIQDHENLSKEVGAQAQKLKDDKADQTTAHQRMEQARAAAKKKSDALVDKAYDAAEAAIDKLPAKHQDAAVDTWLLVQKGFFAFWQSALDAFDKMISAIAEWLEGVWEKVEVAWHSVKTAFSNAWAWFKGLFG